MSLASDGFSFFFFPFFYLILSWIQVVVVIVPQASRSGELHDFFEVCHLLLHSAPFPQPQQEDLKSRYPELLPSVLPMFSKELREQNRYHDWNNGTIPIFSIHAYLTSIESKASVPLPSPSSPKMPQNKSIVASSYGPLEILVEPVRSSPSLAPDYSAHAL